jgi:hypothetical protein
VNEWLAGSQWVLDMTPPLAQQPCLVDVANRLGITVVEDRLK